MKNHELYQQRYVTPAMDVLEIVTEAGLCQSDIDLDGGIDNMLDGGPAF